MPMLLANSETFSCGKRRNTCPMTLSGSGSAVSKKLLIWMSSSRTSQRRSSPSAPISNWLRCSSEASKRTGNASSGRLNSRPLSVETKIRPFSNQTRTILSLLFVKVLIPGADKIIFVLFDGVNRLCQILWLQPFVLHYRSCLHFYLCFSIITLNMDVNR